MNDPVSLLQLIVAVLCAVVPLSAIGGTALWRLSRMEVTMREHISEDKLVAEDVHKHVERIIAVERDVYAMKSRETVLSGRLDVMEEKIDKINNTVIRIDERLSRDDTGPKRRMT